MKETIINITVFEAQGRHELPTADAALLQAAAEATKNAYAPYSKFSVGAAVLLDNGEVICGNNQENAAFPSGLCAERTALFYANSRYPNVAVKAVAIHASMNGKLLDNPVFPCGSCRQVILEAENRYNRPIRIIMGGEHTTKVVNSIKDLLPLSFKL